MDTADRAAYLARIGYRGATGPSPAVLADLQLAHLLTVPFEKPQRFGIDLDQIAGSGRWIPSSGGSSK